MKFVTLCLELEETHLMVTKDIVGQGHEQKWLLRKDSVDYVTNYIFFELEYQS